MMIEDGDDLAGLIPEQADSSTPQCHAHDAISASLKLTVLEDAASVVSREHR